MRTVTFKSVLWGVAYRAGLDPGGSSPLRVNEARALTEYINAAVRIAYRRFEWPDIVSKSQETASSQAIALAANGIGLVLGVTEEDPDLEDTPTDVSFRKRDDNIYLPENYESETVWVRYMPPVPTFESGEWSAATAYATDELAYQPDDGEVYKALQATTGDEPPDATYWVKVDFPEVIAEPVKEGGRSLDLMEEGQHGAGAGVMGKVEALLEEEFMTVSGLEGLRSGYSVAVR